MENASKALIIAGAILISILLIAISMVVYNAGKSAVDTAADQMSSTEIQMYNSSITAYAGSNVKASSVKGCIDEIINSNANYDGQSGKYISLTIVDSTGSTIASVDNSSDVSTSGKDMSAAKTEINAGKRYTIAVTYASTGLVSNVTITEES